MTAITKNLMPVLAGGIGIGLFVGVLVGKTVNLPLPIYTTAGVSTTTTTTNSTTIKKLLGEDMLRLDGKKVSINAVITDARLPEGAAMSQVSAWGLSDTSNELETIWAEPGVAAELGDLVSITGTFDASNKSIHIEQFRVTGKSPMP